MKPLPVLFLFCACAGCEVSQTTKGRLITDDQPARTGSFSSAFGAAQDTGRSMQQQHQQIVFPSVIRVQVVTNAP